MRLPEAVTPASRHAAALFLLQTLGSAAIGIKDTASPAIGIQIVRSVTGDMGGIGAQICKARADEACSRRRYRVVFADTRSAFPSGRREQKELGRHDV